MKLVAIDGLRQELGFDDMTDINEAITSAIEAATPVISARIGSSFDKKTWTDFYYLPEAGFVQGNSVRTEFRLRQGFLQSLTSMSYCHLMTQFGTPDELDLLATNNAIQNDADKERGVVRDISTVFCEDFVKLVYACGFDVDGTDPKLYDQTQVPDWLQRAAYLYAKMILASNPAVTEANIKIDKNALQIEYNAILGAKVRYTPTAILPM